MKEHPRIRKTITWGGAVVTVLLVVVWIGSVWCWVGWESGSGENAWIGTGGLGVCLSGFPDPYGLVAIERCQRGWFFGWHPAAMRMRPFVHNLDGGFSRSFIPLWIPILILLVPTSFAWRLDTLARRRAKGGLNLCPKCGYNRTGLPPGAACPECGSGATTPRRSA